MAFPTIPIWKEAPFIRLLIPFIGGIMVQWYFEWPCLLYWSIITISIAFTFLFSFINAFVRYRYYWVAGVFINLLLFNCGTLFTYYGDNRHQQNRSNDLLKHNSTLVVTLDEPLSEKTNSFKANAVIKFICRNDSLIKSSERIIVYFEKDSSFKEIHYNSRLVFSKPLLPIGYNGNPGAFNYQRYCALQGIYYQAYLKKRDFIVLPEKKEKLFNRYLFSSRQRIVDIIRKYVRGKKEAGLAEALLIGYKDDLDKILVQSYSNTGVVHIIAISGLHVGLIYWILNLLLYLLGRKRGMRWLKAALVIGGLWMFGFLAGGSASVLRSALMFTFIVTGENIGKKSGIYNSLAASAFLLLCYNPFWLWDAGFLLSYTAVLSIVIFMKRIYHWFFIQNKLLDLVWKMIAISVSAQILTTPLSIFLFHQFPNYFLVTNLVVVPLSSLILIAELILCAGYWIPLVANAVGWAVSWLITLMNGFVEHISLMPFSTLEGLQLSVAEVIIIYLAIVATSCWMFWKNRRSLIIAMIFLMCLVITRTASTVKALNQRLLIVYNIPHHRATELLYSNSSYFIGDKEINENILLRNLYLKPAHTFYRVNRSPELPIRITGNRVYFCNKRILFVDGRVPAATDSSRCIADIVIISGNPDIYMEQLFQIVNCNQFVFDSSNPPWKIKRWRSECEKYGISCYSVAENGAFILNMN